MQLPVRDGFITNLKLDSSLFEKRVGIDISAQYDFNVFSCSDGKVLKVFKLSSESMYTVVIKFGNRSFVYSQLDTSRVRPGQYVKEGDVIGLKMVNEKVFYKYMSFAVYEGNKELPAKNFLKYR